MANTVIKYDISTPGGQQLRAAIIEMQDAYEKLQKLANVLTACDAATTPASIEIGGANADLFGVPSGGGAAFNAAVVSLASALNAVNRAQLGMLFR